MRKTIRNGSNSEDREQIRFNQENWSSGAINDPPSSAIPDDSIADGENVLSFPKEIVSRTGSRLYCSAELPPLSGRTNYIATKEGYIVTTVQNHFTQLDVGNYFVWPGTETEHDEIIRYINGTQVEVANTGDKTVQYGCYIRGDINAWKFHSVLRQWLFLLGTELWVVSLDMETWVAVKVVSRDVPTSAKSSCGEFDEYSWYLDNANGVFRIDAETSEPLAYKVNCPIPNIAILEQSETPTTIYQYGYIYGAARLFGESLFRDRLTPSRIETETGANAWGPDYKDYNDVWSEDPIGPETATYQILTCGTLVPPYDVVSGFNTIADATFLIDINGDGEFTCFSDLTSAETMTDVAAIIQTSLRDHYPDATCVFSSDHFVMTPGRKAGYTISYLRAAGTGTSIAGVIAGSQHAGAEVSISYVTVHKVVGPLYVPNVPNTNPEEYQWHLTHFPIYRTKDKAGLYKQGTSQQRLNDPERYIWTYDLRICGAFYAYKYNGHVLAQIGQFEEADVGSTIEWEDGSRDTILEYVAPDDVIVDDPGYYSENTSLMACAIGNGRVMRASQTGTTVTRTHGGAFTSADVRKTITWSTGYRSIITAFVDANTVTVAEDYDKDVQGMTIDPVYRYYNDIITDDTLGTRETSLLCKTRFLEAMSNGNTGVIVPGYFISAQRGNNVFEYCELPVNYEYLLGFHNKGYQISKTIKGDIQELFVMSNKFIAFCSSNTYGGPTNISDFVTMPKTGVVVSVLSGIDIIDGSIGCVDWGSIQFVDNGIIRLKTNEPGQVGLRDFNGFSYGPNLLEESRTSQTNWLDSFKKLQTASASIYDGHMGYLIWGRE